MFYNIAKKEEINPFDKVTGVIFKGLLANSIPFPIDSTTKVNAKYIDDEWELVYPLNILNIIVRLNFYNAQRGVIIIDKQKFEFSINDELLVMW